MRPPVAASPPAPDPLVDLVNAGEASLGTLLEARAARTPRRTFLIWNGQHTSYAEALRRIRRVAGALRSATGKRQPRVLTFLPNRPEMLWAWLATAYAGGLLIALNRGQRGVLLAEQVERARADLLVTDREGEALLADMRLPPIRWNIDDRALPEAPPLERPAGNARDIATVMFSSGTTGQSKAVRIPHNQYCRGAARIVEGFGLTEDDVFHNWLPLFHLGGQLHMTVSAIVCGGAVALFPSFSRSHFHEQILSARCSVLCGFAAILHMIWSLPRRKDDAAGPLRVGIFAGIPSELHRPFEQRFGMSLGENYGMTEADPITLPSRQPTSGSSGRPNADFDLAIVDPRGDALGAGETGEIVVRPRLPGIMTDGYEGDQPATDEAFRGGWFHTGDLGLLDSAGELHFRGRLSGYIRRRGENISAAEAEQAFAMHPDIAECAVVGVPSRLGEEDVKLVVALRTGARADARSLFDWGAERVARFMLPRYIEIVDALPRSKLGKVVIHELRGLSPGVWDAEEPQPPSSSRER